MKSFSAALSWIIAFPAVVLFAQLLVRFSRGHVDDVVVAAMPAYVFGTLPFLQAPIQGFFDGVGRFLSGSEARRDNHRDTKGQRADGEVIHGERKNRSGALHYSNWIVQCVFATLYWYVAAYIITKDNYLLQIESGRLWLEANTSFVRWVLLFSVVWVLFTWITTIQHARRGLVRAEAVILVVVPILTVAYLLNASPDFSTPFSGSILPTTVGMLTWIIIAFWLALRSPRLTEWHPLPFD